MEDNVLFSIKKTLIYADIFNFPMKKEEIWKFLISSEKVSKKYLYFILRKNFKSKNDLFFLHGKSDFVFERLLRTEESKKKNEKIKKTAKILSFIPTILLIGVSGSLALENAKSTDDIDIFIITKKNTLWITRFLTLLTLIVLGSKRGREEKLAQDKICPNMFLSEDALCFSKVSQNLFIAHEISQLKVLFNRQNTYEHFLHSNLWILDFLPNSIRVKKNFEKRLSNLTLIFSVLIYPFESIARIIQIMYMRKRRTCEVVSRNAAQFHPKDIKNYVLELYDLKCLHALGRSPSEASDYSRILT